MVLKSLVLMTCVAICQIACSPSSPSTGGTSGSDAGPLESTPDGSGGRGGGTGGGRGAGAAGAGGIDASAAADTTTPQTSTDALAGVEASGDVQAGVDGGLSSKDFVCSWVLGITTTGEWYRAGFEKVVDDARWQITPIEMGHLEKWADPQNPIWQSAIQSPCAQNSKTPDRIVFNATKYEWTTVAEFLPAYLAFVNNVKTKYPSVKRIDLMTYGRAPGNKQCDGANRPTYSWIKPVQDDAAAMVQTMFPGLVFNCPKWEHKSCSDFELCPHVTPAANATLAKTIGEYFLQN